MRIDSAVKELTQKYYAETEDMLLLIASAGIPLDRVRLHGPILITKANTVKLSGGVSFR